MELGYTHVCYCSNLAGGDDGQDNETTAEMRKLSVPMKKGLIQEMVVP